MVYISKLCYSLPHIFLCTFSSTLQCNFLPVAYRRRTLPYRLNTHAIQKLNSKPPLSRSTNALSIVRVRRGCKIYCVSVRETQLKLCFTDASSARAHACSLHSHLFTTRLSWAFTQLCPSSSHNTTRFRLPPPPTIVSTLSTPFLLGRQHLFGQRIRPRPNRGISGKLRARRR